jgi:hypothetical protein
MGKWEIMQESSKDPGNEGEYPMTIVMEKHTKSDGFVEYVTHIRVLPDGRDSRGTEPYEVSGQYFKHEADALEDYKARCLKYRLHWVP